MRENDRTVSPYLQRSLRSYADVISERRRGTGLRGQAEVDYKPDAGDPTRSRGHDGNDLV